jgi:hypothetical protein
MQVENLWWLRDFSRSSHPDILWDGLLFGSGWIGILFLFGFFFFFIAQVLGPAVWHAPGELTRDSGSIPSGTSLL